MTNKRMYPGLDLLKLAMAVLVAGRHMIQVFYQADSRWRLYIGSWLSNLAVPVFFIIAGFLLFRKVPEAGRSRGSSSGTRTVLAYCWRILKLYLIWCVLYWPIDLYNWYHGTQSFPEFVRSYVKSFFFSSTIAQLWYLPALLTACLIVWALCRVGMRLRLLLILTGALFAAGCLGDNWFYTERMPMEFQQWVAWYAPRFITMRNGIFYGTFYVSIGMWFARKKDRLPFLVSALGALACAYLMYKEVKYCQITNMAFFAAPTAVFLAEGAMALPLPGWRLFPRLRGVSEWVYFSHFYFFYLFSWTAHLLPVPLTERNIALIIFVPMLLVCWCVVLLSERERGRWLRRLI